MSEPFMGGLTIHPQGILGKKVWFIVGSLKFWQVKVGLCQLIQLSQAIVTRVVRINECSVELRLKFIVIYVFISRQFLIVILVDIDECEEPRSCVQVCNNFIGSYTCDCQDHFKLSDNKYCTAQSRCSDLFCSLSGLQ